MPNGVGRLRYLDDTAPKPKVSKGFVLRILKYFVPHWKMLLVAMLALLVSSVLGLVPSIIIKNIMDKALPNKDMKYLAILVLISIGATIIQQLIQVGQTYLNTLISKKIILKMKNEMYYHLQHMSLRFFTTAKPGEIITRMNSDIDGVQDVFNSTVVSVLSNFFIIVSSGVTVFIMNWKLAILGLFIIPLFIVPTRKVGKIRWRIATKSQEKMSEMNQLIQETLSISGSILTKIFTKEKNEYKKFEDINTDVIKLQIKESLAGRWFNMTITVLSSIEPMAIYFYGGYLYTRGEISIGDIIAFVALLTRLYGPVAKLSDVHINITRSFALFERIFNYFDLEHEIVNKADADVLSSLTGRIEFCHVYFSYNKKADILKDINFSIEPGTMVALVGSSGSGKTTITNLIPRLYDVTQGCVRIDGEDVRDLTVESLRNNIGIVMQEPYLFNNTIEENLRYARENATEEEIINACKAAYIHDFIMTLPDKYKTIVGNRGIKLSGGEKQRISIARVILKDPGIIILDEATSSLDSVSEKYIQKAMVPLLNRKTSLVIAHRLSTILAADQIIVVEKGIIAEMGKHDELLNMNGLYKKLYDTQFKTQIA